MDPSEQYEQVCRGEFAEIKQTLCHIDKALRGHENTPGIMERIRLLERAERRRSHAVWAVITAAAGAVVLTLVNAIVGLVQASGG